MRAVFAVFAFAAVANVARAEEVDIAKFDPNMAVAGVSVTNGIKWIDGRLLPIEGRVFDDELDPAVEAKYRKALGYDGKIERMERFAFYERAKKAYAVVVSGETAKYGNIILKKGVTPIAK